MTTGTRQGLSESLRTMDQTSGHRELYARFKVDKYLGKGALGSVFKVRALEDGAEFAVKEVEVKHLGIKEKEAAADEIYKLASIDHPCCVPVYDAFTDTTTLCVVMGYIPGYNLATLLQQGVSARPSRPLNEELVWKYFIQLCRGLHAYHLHGVVHRNVKPSNIQVSDGQRLYLAEPGMTELLRTSKPQTTNTAPKYLAPEVWNGRPYSLKSDIWALGCILYEMCTYKVPFEARDMQGLSRQINGGRFAPISSKYNPELAKVVYSLLVTDPELRPNTHMILNSDVIKHYSKVLLNDIDLGIPSTVSEVQEEIAEA